MQSRYYDPKIGRFINADALVSTGAGIVGYNMFAYCNNNPANSSDPTGMCPMCLAGKNSDQIMTSVFCGFGGGGGGGRYTRKATSRDKTNGLITDQDTFPYANEAVGFGSYADNGCAIIATYNALQLLGRKVSLGSIRDEYLFKHGTILLGLGGVGPWSIEDYFDSHDIECTGYPLFGLLRADVPEGSVVIFTLMNNINDIGDGFHTMAAQYINGVYHVYNGYGNGVQIVNNICDLTDAGFLIWGCIVGG